LDASSRHKPMTPAGLRPKVLSSWSRLSHFSRRRAAYPHAHGLGLMAFWICWSGDGLAGCERFQSDAHSPSPASSTRGQEKRNLISCPRPNPHRVGSEPPNPPWHRGHGSQVHRNRLSRNLHDKASSQTARVMSQPARVWRRPSLWPKAGHRLLRPCCRIPVKLADELCVIRSMHTDQEHHDARRSSMTQLTAHPCSAIRAWGAWIV